jgi:hypothetical protein
VRGLRLALLLAAVFGALAFFWRAKSEPGRRYERIHALLAAHRLRNLDDWTVEESRILWADLDWFSREETEEFDARLMGSILEGAFDEKDRALRLARDVLHFSGWGGPGRRQHTLPRIPHPRSLDVFAGRFRYPDLILGDPKALGAFLGHADESVRTTLFYLDDLRPSPATRAALLRMAETDSVLALRLGALYRLAGEDPGPAEKALLRRLLSDRTKAVLATSAAILAVWGDVTALDLLLGFVLDRNLPVEPVEFHNALLFAAGGEGALSWDLPGLRRDIDPPGPGEFVEVIERLLYSLERRRIGELAEPPPE